MGGGGEYVFVVALVLAVVLSLLLVFWIGQLRDRRVRRDFARDVGQGVALLERQLDDLAPYADRATNDARERLTAARALLDQGTGLPVLRAARHTLLEGLAAAYAARGQAGLEPGSMPPSPNDAPLTDAPVTIEVAGVLRTALPRYAPGSVHHFAGGVLAGVDVPGGWYTEPFWEPMLLESTPADT